ncbi:hypothetical protein E5676_scaffold392G00060 [Cucumis melo var. makuwa]|uniref:Uncharacterized protein n=1 Tax=Cucumis melo var. makuwa TaxID=1194695 RepID=A0A5A7VQX4_CUCMM|nr:hypothetical protein E6C27_scaffold238G00860 [Cucumis melo var. makuwa]TYK21048.1 hypothetical protein E5676_scaffold392G00060 [Cucumis melo var. makuwa]
MAIITGVGCRRFVGGVTKGGGGWRLASDDHQRWWSKIGQRRSLEMVSESWLTNVPTLGVTSGGGRRWASNDHRRWSPKVGQQTFQPLESLEVVVRHWSVQELVDELFNP